MIVGYDSPEISEKRVGPFRCVLGQIYGPREYMHVRGFDLLHQIYEGKDDDYLIVLRCIRKVATINACADIEIALLSRLQDDWEDWKLGVEW